MYPREGISCLQIQEQVPAEVVKNFYGVSFSDEPGAKRTLEEETVVYFHRFLTQVESEYSKVVFSSSRP